MVGSPPVTRTTRPVTAAAVVHLPGRDAQGAVLFPGLRAFDTSDADTARYER